MSCFPSENERRFPERAQGKITRIVSILYTMQPLEATAMNIPMTDETSPFLTTMQMIKVDRLTIEDDGIDLARMMENAGRNLAHLARARFLNGDPGGRLVVALAGTGGNGGGALAAPAGCTAMARRCRYSRPSQMLRLPRGRPAAWHPAPHGRALFGRHWRAAAVVW